MLHRRLPTIRPSHWIAILLMTLLAGAGTVSAQPVLEVEPLYDIEPTGASWPFPSCPVNECPPLVGAQVHQLTILDDGSAAFSAFDFDHGLELWITDGTSAGTERLTDLCPGPCHAEPWILGTVGDFLVFTATQDGEDLGLWATDGSTVELLASGRFQAGAVSPEPIDGWLYFRQEAQVWRTNGVIAEVAASFPEGGIHLPTQTFGIGERVFAARRGFLGAVADLWQVSPQLVRVLRLCAPTLGRVGFERLGAAAFFGAECVEGLPDLGPGLFRTGGGPGDVERVATLPDGPPSGLFRAAGALYFLEPVESSGASLQRVWVSDGTAAGTVPVSEPFTGPYHEVFGRLGRYLLIGGSLRLSAVDLESGTLATLLEIPANGGPATGRAVLAPTGRYALLGNRDGWWITLGTPQETRQLFSHGEPILQPRSGAAFLGHRALFGGSDGASGADLWAFVGESSVLEVPALGPAGLFLLGLLLAAAALRSMSR